MALGGFGWPEVAWVALGGLRKPGWLWVAWVALGGMGGFGWPEV